MFSLDLSCISGKKYLLEKSKFKKNICFNKKTQSHKLLDCPEWLYDKLIEEHDKNDVEKYLKISKSKPKIWIRVNTLKTTLQDIIYILKENDIEFDINTQIDNFVSIDKFDKNPIKILDKILIKTS